MFYPLAIGNKWTYSNKNGEGFTNSVTGIENAGFSMMNSFTNSGSVIRLEGFNYETDSFEAGNFQTLLREAAKPGDSWEVRFKANTLDNIMVMTVKETGATKEVNGKTFNNVMLVESESKINMNRNIMTLNYFTQYYYSYGVGLILTTSSMGEEFGLTSFELK